VFGERPSRPIAAMPFVTLLARNDLSCCANAATVHRNLERAAAKPTFFATRSQQKEKLNNA
jgi:hypothetical protein